MITKSSRLGRLLSVVDEHGEAFNPVHCSAVWTRLGNIVKENPAQKRWLWQNMDALNAPREHTLRLLSSSGPRQLAHFAWGAAHCEVDTGPPWSLFWSQIASAAIEGVRDLDSRALKDLAWAFAKSGYQNHRLFDAIARETSDRLSVLRPEEVAILAWSFASSGHHDSLLMDGLAYAAEANVTRMASSELATTVWAFGKSGLSGGQAADSFFAALSEELPRRLAHLRPHALATIAHGLGSCGRATPAQLEQIAVAVLQRPNGLDAFDAHSLVTLAAPYALFASDHLEECSHQILRTAVDLAAQRASELEPSSLVTMARVVANALVNGSMDPDVRTSELYVALASCALPRLHTFKERDLSMIVWAFCRARQHPHTSTEIAQLFEGVANESGGRLFEFTSGGLNALAWSFSHAFARDGGHSEAAAALAQELGADAHISIGSDDVGPAAILGDEAADARITLDPKLQLPESGELLFALLGEELAGRRGELSENETLSCELAFRRLGRPSPFDGLVAARGENYRASQQDLGGSHAHELLY